MTAEEIEPPVENPLGARRGEGLLLVQQNNVNKSLIINAINATLASLLGYDAEEILDRHLEIILGKREAELIAEDLEYSDDAPDLGDIFSRIREVHLRRRTGEEIPVECTLSRLMAQDGHASFQLVIPNEHERVAKSKLSNFIALNLEGRKELDVATGLPNRHTADQFLPLLKNFFADTDMQVVFAMLRMDRHEKSMARYGQKACSQLMLHVAHICQSTFRADDLVFVMSDSTLGVVLFNISQDSARVVFNRLRWKIRNHRFSFGGKADFSISTCIGFDALDMSDVAGMLTRAEEKMAAIDAGARNMLLELAKA